MIVYNMTIKVEPTIDADWLLWQKQEHIPEVLNTKLFTDFKLYRLLEQDEDGGNTYVIQFFADTAALLEEYLENHAQKLREKAFKKWGDRFIAFRTTMELVK